MSSSGVCRPRPWWWYVVRTLAFQVSCRSADECAAIESEEGLRRFGRTSPALEARCLTRDTEGLHRGDHTEQEPLLAAAPGNEVANAAATRSQTGVGWATRVTKTGVLLEKRRVALRQWSIHSLLCKLQAEAIVHPARKLGLRLSHIIAALQACVSALVCLGMHGGIHPVSDAMGQRLYGVIAAPDGLTTGYVRRSTGNEIDAETTSPYPNASDYCGG